MAIGKKSIGAEAPPTKAALPAKPAGNG
ncbi:DUF6053 domain-containing protein [Lysobacter sp. TAB13]